MTLRVTVEIVPYGDEYKRSVVEVINISNLGNYFDELGTEYVVEYNSYKSYDDNTPRVYHYRGDGSLKLIEKAVSRLNGN